MLDERTIYNYVDAGLLSVGNIDLPRKVVYRKRKGKKTVRVDKKCHLGRTYEMGYGTETDLAQAASWYQKAAQNGDKDAAARLSALREAEKTRGLLTGQWGDTEAIHNGTTAAFYLDSPVTDCGRLTMTLRIVSYTGYPFGEWYLYLLDTKENWTHVAKFNIDKQQADGRTVTYDLVFDSPESFRALAICPAENGMEFTLGRELLFYNR